MNEEINTQIQREKKSEQADKSIDRRLQDITRSREKYLVFTLDEKRYGIALASVKEVIGITNLTPVPGAPNFFKGLINLRGKIHSVIDLRIKF